MGKVVDLRERYPETYHAEQLDMTDTAAIHKVLENAFSERGRIDVIISNAGYGLFGAMVLGSQALEGTLATLRKRIEDFEAQTELASSTDFPSGE